MKKSLDNYKNLKDDNNNNNEKEKEEEEDDEYTEESVEKRKREREGDIVWGAHIRHGDVAALPEVYKNRKVFSFSDFFRHVKEKANAMEQCIEPLQHNENILQTEREKEENASTRPVSSSDEHLPTALFVSSDNPKTSEFINDPTVCSYLGDWEEYLTVFTVDSKLRFRTPHGSHTVAADGGCTPAGEGAFCGLLKDQIELYQIDADIQKIPKQERMLRVLYEGVEDMYYLAHNHMLFTQMTSHFSTYAVMLSWARFGAKNPLSTVFLDYQQVEQGKLHCAMLMANIPTRTEYRSGYEEQRWIEQTLYFYEGLSVTEAEEKNITTPLYLTLSQSQYIREETESYIMTQADEENKINNEINTDNDIKHKDSKPFLLFDITNTKYFRMFLKENIPQLPQRSFELESRRWLGNDDRKIWPGECPLERKKNQSVQDYVTVLLNFGADRYLRLENQGIKCWRLALEIIKEQEEDGEDGFDDAKEIALNNLETVQKRRMCPYSMGKESIMRFYFNSIGKILEV